MIRISLAREARDDIGAESEDGEPRGEPLDARAVGVGRVPVAPHALEEAVRARLQRRVQVRREVLRRLDQKSRDAIVDLGGLDGREAEAGLGDGLDERVQELAQGRLTPGASPGSTHTRNAWGGINPGLAPALRE